MRNASSPLLSEANDAWLNCFRAEKKRNPRILHIGNIANNAYNNAKLLRSAGFDSDVLCYDYYHVMACPEWEDADFHGTIADPNRPDWTQVDLKGFTRPDWFVQGPTPYCLAYLLARDDQNEAVRKALWEILGQKNRTTPDQTPKLPGRASTLTIEVARKGLSACKLLQAIATSPDITSKLLRGFNKLASPRTWFSGTLLCAGLVIVSTLALLSRLIAGIGAATGHILITGYVIFGNIGGQRQLTSNLVIRQLKRKVRRLLKKIRWKSGINSYLPSMVRSQNLAPRINSLVSKFYSAFPDRPDQLKFDDVEQYLPLMEGWEKVLSRYDFIQGYATDGVYPLLAGKAYAAYEHGTIRDIPFEPTSQGRICAITYNQADVVFVTNSDNVEAARKLGISDSRVVCLPHSFDSSRVRVHANFSKQCPSGEKAVFFSPARHHWKSGAPSWRKGNDEIIKAIATLSLEGLAFQVIFVDWGSEVELSRKLIEELHCGHCVVWVPPMRKTQLWDNYLRSNAVIDQFVMPAIGGVAFEAMCLSKRVITRIDEQTLERFFGECPPLLNAQSAEEIAAAMRSVIDDPLDSKGQGEKASEWIDKFHSPERILNLQISAYQQFLQ